MTPGPRTYRLTITVTAETPEAAASLAEDMTRVILGPCDHTMELEGFRDGTFVSGKASWKAD